MTDTRIQCPNCGAGIPISEALAEQVRGELEQSLRTAHERRLASAVTAAKSQAREESRLELRDMKAQLLERDARLKTAQTAELGIRRKLRELEERQRDMELELERRLDVEREKILRQAHDRMQADHELKIKEKERQIEGLRKALDEARRKSELGSQQTQGEALELNIESALKGAFPLDSFSSVPTGMRGADLIQNVLNDRGADCGAIIWEIKNTRNWSPAWIQKLKDDQRAVGARLAVLVSVALPQGVHNIARIDGVWIASIHAYPALATALREQLIQVAFAHNAQTGKNEKMEMLYRYFAGDEFRHRVEAMAETFTSMKIQLDKERRAMERLWKEREKQIERIAGNTVGMYGELRGIIGSTLPEIGALDLDEIPRLEKDG